MKREDLNTRASNRRRATEESLVPRALRGEKEKTLDDKAQRNERAERKGQGEWLIPDP